LKKRGEQKNIFSLHSSREGKSAFFENKLVEKMRAGKPL